MTRSIRNWLCDRFASLFVSAEPLPPHFSEGTDYSTRVGLVANMLNVHPRTLLQALDIAGLKIESKNNGQRIFPNRP